MTRRFDPQIADYSVVGVRLFGIARNGVCRQALATSNTVLLLRTGKSHQVRPSTIASRNDQVNPITRPRSTAASAC